MKLHTIHIIGLMLFLFGFPELLIAQDTTAVNATYQHFQKNLIELDDFAGSQVAVSQIEELQAADFKKAFQKLNLPFFNTPVQEAEDFYHFLNHIPKRKKEQLIQRFHQNEPYYSTVFEEAGLPVEFKYAAPAFSAMNLNAVGEDGRAGVWQITHFQGILNGLTLNRLVDERLNDRLAVYSYAKEIQQNITLFGSVELALLAQWFGRTKVQNAIAYAADEKSTEDILNYFPASATQKIAAFQAIVVFLNNNLVVESRGAIAQIETPDTIHVFNQLHFKQISEVLNIAENQLVRLNPQFRFEIIPEAENGYQIVVPEGLGEQYLSLQDSIYNAFDSTLFEITAQTIEYPPAPTRQYLGEPVKDLEIEGKTKIKYRLKTGDVLGIIAEKYDVRVADLKYWNNITNERRIQAGKNIDIFVDDDQADYYQNLDKTVKEEVAPADNFAQQLQHVSALEIFEVQKDTPSVEYEVKSGESPYTIAKKFEGITPDDILMWNNIDDARKIQIGQKLTIYLKN